MCEVFLLDTNALFNYLKYVSLFSTVNPPESHQNATRRIKLAKCYISIITQIEIISVIGKYARGGSEVNNIRMKRRVVLQWMKLIDQITHGDSELLKVSILSVSESTFIQAHQIIQHALEFNFGSLDAIIAATAAECCYKKGFESIVLVTSDKGLKACLHKKGIAHWDAFIDPKIPQIPA